MAASVMEEAPELSCMLIPLHGTPLLLPSSCVAEILPWRRITPVDGAPEWFLGRLGWRGQSIPVLRFERINEPRAESAASGRCLVVMNRSAQARTPETRVAFYAIAADGLPRMVQLADGDVSEAQARLGRAESMVVDVGTERATIPNLGFLEQQVETLR